MFNTVQSGFSDSFLEIDREEAWPDTLAIIKENVKPGRERLGNSLIDKAHKMRWWRFANDRPELRAATAGLERVLAIDYEIDEEEWDNRKKPYRYRWPDAVRTRCWRGSSN